MSRTLWDEFLVAFSAAHQLEVPTASNEDGQDLPIFLYTRERPEADGQGDDAAPDIAYIGLDEANEEVVTHICLDAADPDSPRVLLQVLEQNNYLFAPSDPVFSLTPDGKAVTLSARHPLRALLGEDQVANWSQWLEGFLDTARLWNQDLERLSLHEIAYKSAHNPAHTSAGGISGESAENTPDEGQKPQEHILRA